MVGLEPETRGKGEGEGRAQPRRAGEGIAAAGEPLSSMSGIRRIVRR